MLLTMYTLQPDRSFFNLIMIIKTEADLVMSTSVNLFLIIVPYRVILHKYPALVLSLFVNQIFPGFPECFIIVLI